LTYLDAQEVYCYKTKIDGTTNNNPIIDQLDISTGRKTKIKKIHLQINSYEHKKSK